MTKLQGKKPCARDGHSGIIIGVNFLVFGGDRHHTSFNDFHLLDLLSEFENRNLVYDE
jgi:hypothetical protein